MSFWKYINLTSADVLKELKTSSLGLSSTEAANRLLKYGPNALPSKNFFWRKFLLDQIKSPFFGLVFLLGSFSLLTSKGTDGALIFIFLGINFVLEFFHEIKTKKIIKKLKTYVSEKIGTIRNGKLSLSDVRDLVPGDVVRLKPGDKVPADLRIIEEKGLWVDESMLNGERDRVPKTAEKVKITDKDVFKASNIVFLNSTVISGLALGVVVATGKKTYLGEISAKTKNKKDLSLYEKEIFDFSRRNFRWAMGTVLVFFSFKIFFNGTENFSTTFAFYLALAVSVLPEALTLVVSSALLRGAMRMADRHVVVKRLSSIEDLGNIEILCVDKTGTITEDKLVLERVFSSEVTKCIHLAKIASSFVKEDNSFESAFDRALFEESSLKERSEFKKIRHLDSLPFDYNRMRSSILIKDGKGKRFVVMRGAVEMVLKYCFKSKTANFRKIISSFKKEGSKGNRILAVAVKRFSRKLGNLDERDEKNFTFVGFLSFADPLKKSAVKTVALAKKMGVEIKILTGDFKEPTTKIAKEINLIDSEKSVISRQEMEVLSERKFKEACQKFKVFARISPEIKIRIIKNLQRDKKVGFLGEGINDALALGSADVGLAVEKAAGVSRNVSDILLLCKDLKVVIEGINEGRKVFANLNKYTKSALCANFGNFLALATASFFWKFMPILPVQILLINLLSDLSLVGLATDRVSAEELKKPASFDFYRFLRLIIILVLINFLMGITVLGIFREAPLPTIQTVWFITSVFSQIALIFVLRGKRFFWEERASGYLLVSIFISLFLVVFFPLSSWGQTFFHLSPLSPVHLMLVGGITIVYFIFSELAKFFYYKRFEN